MSINIDGLLVAEQAVLTDTHVVFTSKQHGDTYIDLRVFAHKTAVLNELSKELASAIIENYRQGIPSIGHHRENFLFLGPETLGRDYARLVSTHYNRYTNAASESIFCEVDEQGAYFSKKLDFGRLVPGRKVVFVDDLLNESSTFFKVKKLVEDHGGEVVLVLAIINRQLSKNTPEYLGVPQIITLKDFDNLKSYDPEWCPLCELRIPMRERPGHGHEWLLQEENQGYPVAE